MYSEQLIQFPKLLLNYKTWQKERFFRVYVNVASVFVVDDFKFKFVVQLQA